MSLNQNKNPVRVALYVRVSTTMQATDGFSIDAQTETLTQYCKNLGYDIYHVYIDKGLSGSSMGKRPGLLQLLEDAEQQKFEKVYVWKLSRLARNLGDLITIVDQFQQQNIDFHSYSENFEVTTSTGLFMMQLLAAVSEYEKNIIVDNVKLGQAQRAMSGYTNGARVLGYDKPDTPKEPIKINEYEAEIVKTIFDLYLKSYGLRSIANKINHRGFRTKRGNTFSTDAIKQILQNPVYAGMVRFNNYVDWAKKRRRGKNENPILVEGQHEAIISKEQWDAVKVKMKQRSYTPKVLGDGSNILTGLVKCPQCGSSTIASNTTNRLKDGTKRQIRYYSCQQFRYKGSSVCSANSVRADDIEERVKSEILKLLNQPFILKKVVASANNRAHEASISKQKQQPQLEEDIIELSNQIVRLQAASEADPEVKAMLSQRISDMQVELSNKKKQMNQIEIEPVKTTGYNIYSERELEKVLEQLQAAFEKGDKMKIKQMYLTIIDKITFEKVKGRRKIDKLTIYLKKDIGNTLLENYNTSEASDDEASLSLYSEGIRIHSTNETL